MGRYIIRRLLLLFPTAFFVSLVVFFSIRLVPGDVIDTQLAQIISAGGTLEAGAMDRLREELGLNEPAYKQYFLWLGGIARGDLGDSLFYRVSATSELRRSIPVSLELAIMAVFISVAIAIPFGALAAIRQDSWVDYVTRLLSVGALSIPSFVVGTLMVVMPSIWFNWLPPLGYRSFFDSPGRNLVQFILPALALGMASTATTLRMTRSSMLEVLRSDYIRTAWAKGLTQRMIIVRHALKNALIAPITLIGGQLSVLLGGTVIIENIFALPGVGRLTLDAIQLKDYTQLQANVLFLALVFVIMNLLVDLSYAWLDPRIRYG